MAELQVGVNDLATVSPELASQWHPIKNGNLTPQDVAFSSHKKVWWYLPYDVPLDYPVEHLRGKHFDFDWEASINSRAKGLGCPYLSGKSVWKGFNDLVTTHSELSEEWHYIKNGNLRPTDVTAGSHKNVWWLLSYDVPDDYPVEYLRGRHFDFEWETEVKNRAIQEYRCPYLSGKRVWKGFNDLETLNPELAAQWHPTKNIGLKDKNGNDISTPDKVIAGTHQKAWWLLPYDDPTTGKHFDFEWEAEVKSRNEGNGCPYLTGNAVWKGFNDLETLMPELATQWHPTKNGNLTPYDVTINSTQNVWWKMSYDVPIDYEVEHLRGKHFDFEWKSLISNRSRGITCPYLTGNAVWVGYNDLATVNSRLAKEWHPIKNIGLRDGNNRDISTPDKVTETSAQKVWWYLPYDVPMDYPIEHLRGKHFDFEWQAVVTNRKDNGCPFLYNKAVWKGFNDFATTHPELAKEWHPTKNGDLTPDKITYGSSKKVWWYLPYDDPKTGEHFNFEWIATVGSRTSGNRCPFILSSKGEESVRKILKLQKIDFEEQYVFKDRFYKTPSRPLKDDFAIFDKNGQVVATIEFHGEQHYRPVDFAGRGKEWAEEEFKKNQLRDKIKTEYLERHGIRQLIVPYTEFDNAEAIVKNFIEELPKDYDLFNSKESKDVAEWVPPSQQSESSKKAVKEFLKMINDSLKTEPIKRTGFKVDLLTKKDADISI